jgi:anti-anti-sigma factor
VGRGLVVVHAHHQTTDVLSLVGSLDREGGSRFVAQAASALRSGAEHLVVELGDVPVVDAAGLAALLNVLRRVRAAGAGMVLVAVQPQVRDALDETRLEADFSFAPTLAEAEAVLARKQ